MSRIYIFTLGLIIILGLAACSQTEKTGIDFERLATPTLMPALLEIQPTETATPIPTISPTRSLTPVPHTPTPVTPSPEACQSHKGKLEIKEYVNPWSDPVTYRVYTPPCYETENRAYPVLYLLHGNGFDDTQWDRLGADEIADKLIGAGEISPFIMVMPNDQGHVYQPPLNHFDEVLINGLLPLIDEDYRILPGRENRAIGGLSRGGNWAIRLGLANWDIFGSIGAHSAPLFFTDGPGEVENWLSAVPKDSKPRLYLDIGMDDPLLVNVLGFSDILYEYDYPHELYVFPGEHVEEYWGAHVEQYIRWYAKEW